MYLGNYPIRSGARSPGLITPNRANILRKQGLILPKPDPYISQVTALLQPMKSVAVGTNPDLKGNGSSSSSVTHHQEGWFPDGRSLMFHGTNTNYTISNSNVLGAGTSTDFTVELRLSYGDFLDTFMAILCSSSAGTGPYGYIWSGSASVALQFGARNGNGISANFNLATTQKLQPLEFAWCRSGTTNMIYVNGRKIYSDTTTVINLGASAVWFGQWDSADQYRYRGKLFGARFTLGTCRYTTHYDMTFQPWPWY